jgi:poly(hydroxyalkanoate) depolymerase family esterase
MFRSLLNRAKSAWRRVAAWFRQRFASKPALRSDGAESTVTPNFEQDEPKAPAQAEPIEQAALASTDTITPSTPPRWLEGTAKNAEGRIPWVLTPPERNYRLYIPAATIENRPLLVMIHGCRQDAATFAEATRMNALADQHGFAVLYPDQTEVANPHQCWNWFETETLAGRGETAILLTMIDRAVKRAGADAENVVIAGLSSGGAMAALLAFSYPERFSSVAVHSGLAPHTADTVTSALAVMRDGADLDIAALTKRYWREHQLPPPPLLVIHGDADDRVHTKNADQLFDLWASLNQAETPNPLPRKQQDFNATTRQRAYRVVSIAAAASAPDQRGSHNTQGFKLAESVRVKGLEHAWSGGNAALPFNDAMGPDASKMIVAFAGLDKQPIAADAPVINR